MGEESRGNNFQIQIRYDILLQHKYKTLRSKPIKCNRLFNVLKECFISGVILIVVLVIMTTITLIEILLSGTFPKCFMCMKSFNLHIISYLTDSKREAHKD